MNKAYCLIKQRNDLLYDIPLPSAPFGSVAAISIGKIAAVCFGLYGIMVNIHYGLRLKHFLTNRRKKLRTQNQGARSHLGSMDMHAAPVARRHRPAKFRPHQHGVLQKVTGRTVVGRLVQDGAEAALGVIEPAGNRSRTAASCRSRIMRVAASDVAGLRPNNSYSSNGSDRPGTVTR